MNADERESKEVERDRLEAINAQLNAALDAVLVLKVNLDGALAEIRRMQGVVDQGLMQ